MFSGAQVGSFLSPLSITSMTLAYHGDAGSGLVTEDDNALVDNADNVLVDDSMVNDFLPVKSLLQVKSIMPARALMLGWIASVSAFGGVPGILLFVSLIPGIDATDDFVDEQQAFNIVEETAAAILESGERFTISGMTEEMYESTITFMLLLKQDRALAVRTYDTHPVSQGFAFLVCLKMRLGLHRTNPMDIGI